MTENGTKQAHISFYLLSFALVETADLYVQLLCLINALSLIDYILLSLVVEDMVTVTIRIIITVLPLDLAPVVVRWL